MLPHGGRFVTRLVDGSEETPCLEMSFSPTARDKRRDAKREFGTGGQTSRLSRYGLVQEPMLIGL